MRHERLNSAPFPLDGGRAGDGGGEGSEGAWPAKTDAEELADFLNPPAEPPTPRPRNAEYGVEVARRLRREQTFSERLLWAELRNLKQNWRRQSPLGRYIVDFVRHDVRLVVEIDGPLHEEPERALRDLERQTWLERQGYRVLRFKDADVKNDAAAVVAMIIAAPAPPPSPTLPPSRGKGDPRYDVR